MTTNNTPPNQTKRNHPSILANDRRFQEVVDTLRRAFTSGSDQKTLKKDQERITELSK